jgi:hypothetical protein
LSLLQFLFYVLDEESINPMPVLVVVVLWLLGSMTVRNSRCTVREMPTAQPLVICFVVAWDAQIDADAGSREGPAVLAGGLKRCCACRRNHRP